MGKTAFTRRDLDLRSRIILKEIFNMGFEVVDLGPRFWPSGGRC